VESGDLDAIFPVVYAELRRLAHRRLGAEVPGHTFSTTALVHETYLKLAAERESDFGNRARFFALAARAMRRILVDYARRHRALKRGSAPAPVSLSELDIAKPPTDSAFDRAEVLIALDEALDRLNQVDARLARVVELRFFVGLTEGESADLLSVTQRTVARDWVRAKAWLRQHLADSKRYPDTA
jgi:RNA polymerase sigma factor (TIGR02999 family)